MLPAPLFADEDSRLAVVHSFDILDTPSEAEFDDLAELASLICGTPVALMSVLDGQRQWFKSRIGMGATETPRDISFCGHAIAQDVLFEVPDALLDARFADNPLASGPAPVRFYAGAPLVARGGFRLGTLCVIDHVPRQLDDTQRQALTALARLVVRQMENRAMARELAVKSRFRDAVIDSTDVAIIAIDISGSITGFNRGAENMLGYAASEVVDKKTPVLFHDAEEIAARAAVLSAESGSVVEPGLATLLYLADRAQRAADDWTFICKDGRRVPVQITLSPIRDGDGALIGCLAVAQDISQRLLAEQARRESDEFIRKVAERVPGVIYQFRLRPDGSSCFPFASEGMRAIYGVSPHDVIDDASSVFEHLDPDDLLRVTQSIHASAASLEPWHAEYRVRGTDGKIRWLQGNAMPQREHDGATLWHGFISDITESKLAHLELEHNQRFLQTLIDMLPVALYTKSFKEGPEGRLILWNKASEHITGYAASAVEGRTNREIFPPEVALHHETHDAEILASRAPVEVPMYRIVRPDGESRVLRTVSVPMFDRHGNLEHVLGVSEDISEMTLQNRELKRKQAELLAVSDASPLGMFRTDAERRVTYVNRTYETITGLTAAQAQGDGWVAALHPDDRNHILASRVAAAADCAAYINTQRFVRPNGTVAVCRVMASPILIDGAFNGFVGTVEDITERRRITDALSQSEQSLRLITSSIPALVAHIDTRQRYLFVNPQKAQVFNKKPESMIGRTMQQEYSSSMYAWLKPYIERALRGETVNFEGRDPTQGSERYFRTTYVPHRNVVGEVAGFYSMTFDITETKLNELAQAAAERRLRTITDNLPVLITYVDGERYLRFANATIADWMGISSAEAIDRPFEDVLGPEIYAHRRAYMDRALAGERVEFEISTEIGGVMRHMQAVYLPDRVADGSVQGFYTLTFDISKLKASEQSLLQLARVDSLTGLANRYQLNEKLDEAVARHHRSRQPMAVLYLDIDRFKQINDTLGHAAGDMILIEFAARLESAIRNTDTVARLSGDEFVVVLENLHSEQEATAVAAKILAAMQPVFSCNGLDRSVSTSIGIAYAAANANLALAESATALLARADKALYAAKGEGRMRFAIA